MSTPADFADVNGDGITDAIFLSPAAKSPPFGHTGAGFVWFGGAGLVGARDPDVELRAPRAVGSSVNGTSAFAADLQFADLTGDGVDDVLIGSPAADVGGVVDAGGWWIFAGGKTMTGFPAPVAALTVPGASADDHLGDAFFLHEIRLIDLDQDGDLDVLATASDADTPASVDAGALYLWRGPFANGGSGVITFLENGPTTSYLLGW
jgi:hypothetical protein